MACSSETLLIPLISHLFSLRTVQALYYLLLLLYLFLGIAIIADIFMCAIERITSQTRNTKVIIDGTVQEVQVRVWNDTVANLTLMALGSSAPEILLSVIEIVGGGFQAGDLGPGTIVGSAAFNLLIITAVCIAGLPDNTAKAIKAIKVFAVTSTFGIFAYLWLFLILVVFSPNVVQVWEAALTFLFFPILVVLAWMADRNFFQPDTTSSNIELGKITEPKKNPFPSGKLTKKTLAKFVKELHAVDPGLSSEDAACLAATYLFENEHHSRLFYRVSACRQLSGTKAPLPHLNEHLQNVYDLWKQKSTRHSKGDVPDGKDATLTIKTVAAEHARDQGIAVVQFEHPTAVVLENAGKVIIGLRRFGKEDISFTCLIETLDRTAKGGLDYKNLKDVITFESGECYKEIEIEIIDDKNWNPDKVFLVRLSLPDGESEEVAKGRICLMTVTIVDDDEPGIIGFEQRIFTVGEGVGQVTLTVLREFGADGQIRVPFKTVDGSAKAGDDYVPLEGELIFAHGEVRKEISIEISDDLKAEKDEYFEVVLISADNGAKLSKINRAMVAVTDDDEQNQEMGQLLSKVRSSSKELKIHREAWIEQFRSAMKVSDGEESTLDYILHVLSFGWKILFAAIPPVGIGGGWVTFFSALVAIGILTAFVGDVASTFGCLIGLDKSVNAITLVALGTSLPDLFASRTAARLEQTADNAIGNVTGSNSVNVFLGLGLPWLIASLYWAAQGKTFRVPAGSLGFSVGLYTAVSLIATGVLLARRMLPLFGNAELGGPKKLALLCSLLFGVLWVIYVGLSALQSYQVIAA